MESQEYKKIIARICRNAIKQRFPGLERKHIDEVSVLIARNVHARMYGANIDGVDSPIWQDRTKDKPEPKIEACVLLQQE